MVVTHLIRCICESGNILATPGTTTSKLVLIACGACYRVVVVVVLFFVSSFTLIVFSVSLCACNRVFKSLKTTQFVKG